MKTVYQVSQKFSPERETEELLTKEFENYQEAKAEFQKIPTKCLRHGLQLQN